MVKNIKNNLHEINDDIEDISKEANITKESIIETAYDIKENLQEIATQSIEDVKTQCENFQSSVSRFCKANPVKAVGIALVSGFLLSRLIK